MSRLQLHYSDGRVETTTEAAIRAAVLGGSLVYERMGVDGDTKYIWDGNSGDDIAAAKLHFEKMLRDGYRAYRIDASGDKGEAMLTFDAQAGRVIFVPPMVGG